MVAQTLGGDPAAYALRGALFALAPAAAMVKRALPEEFLRHAFEELMRTDGTRRLSGEVARAASPAYRARFFEYKTVSPLLAAQVGLHIARVVQRMGADALSRQGRG